MEYRQTVGVHHTLTCIRSPSLHPGICSSFKALVQASFFASIDTLRNWIPLSLYSAYTFLTLGISLRQGPHQLAQKSRTMILPFNFLILMVFPFSFWKVNPVQGYLLSCAHAFLFLRLFSCDNQPQFAWQILM